MAEGWVHFHKNKLVGFLLCIGEREDACPGEQLPPSAGTSFSYAVLQLCYTIQKYSCAPMQRNSDAWIHWCVFVLLIMPQVIRATSCVPCDRPDVCFLRAAEPCSSKWTVVSSSLYLEQLCPWWFKDKCGWANCIFLPLWFSLSAHLESARSHFFACWSSWKCGFLSSNWFKCSAVFLTWFCRWKGCTSPAYWKFITCSMFFTSWDTFCSKSPSQVVS